MKRGFLNKNFILISAAIALCLIVLLTCFSDNLYAKFSTSASDGDGARVAKFEVTDAGAWEEKTLWSGKLAPGDSAMKTVEITNKSEVKIKYKFTVENKSDNLPLQLSVKDSQGNVVDTDGEVEEEIAPNDTDSKKYTINISWPKNESNQNYKYAGMVDYITGTLEVEQVD